MPLVESKYISPWVFKNPHIHTLYPHVFRKVSGVSYVRQRLQLPDGDFIDIDWSKVNGRDLALLVHGLEGSSKETYILGMVKMLNQNNVDTVAINLRSCSGEVNRLPRFYHMGDTDDLRFLIKWIEKTTKYDGLSLIGYSLGANVILKYLGEEGTQRSALLKKAITFSCPIDLQGSSEKLSRNENVIYRLNFMHTRKYKVKLKIKLGILKETDIDFDRGINADSFNAWDDCVTAPLHGFVNHRDYYDKASCYQYLKEIKIPCLLVNALDDPFLSAGSFPREIAKNNSYFYFEATTNGGHVGFIPSVAAQTSSSKGDYYWSECRVIEFLYQNIDQIQ